MVVLSIAACGFVLLAARKKGAVLGSGKRADRRLDAALAVAYLAVGGGRWPVRVRPSPGWPRVVGADV